jgi:hypothetical protein
MMNVQRAPIMSGLSVIIPGVSNSVLEKKFQRPMIKRRAYAKGADQALQVASLGAKKRTDGMARIFQLCGKGIHHRPLGQQGGANNDDNRENEDDNDGSEDDDEEKEPDRPFEPLTLWQSPHQGGPAKGLPPRQ